MQVMYYSIIKDVITTFDLTINIHQKNPQVFQFRASDGKPIFSDEI